LGERRIFTKATPPHPNRTLLLASSHVLAPDTTALLEAHSEKVRNVLVCLALFPEADHLIPERLLDFFLDSTNIDLFHEKILSYSAASLHYLFAVVIVGRTMFALP